MNKLCIFKFIHLVLFIITVSINLHHIVHSINYVKNYHIFEIVELSAYEICWLSSVTIYIVSTYCICTKKPIHRIKFYAIVIEYICVTILGGIIIKTFDHNTYNFTKLFITNMVYLIFSLIVYII